MFKFPHKISPLLLGIGIILIFSAISTAQTRKTVAHENIARMMIYDGKCGRIIPNVKVLVRYVRRQHVDFVADSPEMVQIRAVATKFAAKIQGMSVQRICMLALIEFGPNGKRVRGLMEHVH